MVKEAGFSSQHKGLHGIGGGGGGRIKHGRGGGGSAKRGRGVCVYKTWDEGVGGVQNMGGGGVPSGLVRARDCESVDFAGLALLLQLPEGE